MLQKYLQTLSVVALVLTAALHALPLSTRSRWIIDALSGTRVKLKCVNWAGHMEVMVPEGLDKQPIHHIAAQVASLGFNCVRLTWATYMLTRPNNTKLTVSKSFESIGLLTARDGVHKNNPSLLNLTLVEAQAAVVDELGKNGLMVVLDNHVCKPMWCCSDKDGNGFFGDTYFDPKEWLQGLNLVAAHYKGKSQVVGMSLRNELRGPKQNELDWKYYMQQGARTVNDANPDLLVIASGLSYDTNLGFLRNASLRIDLADKLVYEVHRYSFTNGGRQNWLVHPVNQVCGDLKNRFEDQAGFLLNSSNPVPLFVSEFGVDQRGVNEADNRFLTCISTVVAEKDLDWALWALQGSYYFKNGKAGPEETYGVLDSNWSGPRDKAFRMHYGLLLSITQDPMSKVPSYHILYHPRTGGCARVGRRFLVHVGNCRRSSHWSLDSQSGRIQLMGTSLWITAAGDGKPVVLSRDNSSSSSNWTFLSNSMLHIGAEISQTGQLCMEWNTTSSHAILSKRCICSVGHDARCLDDPRSQWFKLIPADVE